MERESKNGREKSKCPCGKNFNPGHSPKPAEKLVREKCPKSQRRNMSFHVTVSQEEERKAA